ncbi:hypothetical protein AAG906_023434 [Vitis piasezkii]
MQALSLPPSATCHLHCPIYSRHPTTALSKPPLSPMADSPPTYEVEIQSQYHERGGLSISQILALITLLPTGGTLLLFAGLTFAASMVGLAVATPLFLIFSPVLVPAAVVVGLAVSGFVTSQTLGATGVSALSCAWDYLQRVLESSPLKDVVDRMGKGHALKDGPVSLVQFET